MKEESFLHAYLVLYTYQYASELIVDDTELSSATGRITDGGSWQRGKCILGYHKFKNR
jgi:hypothetical protein